MKSVKKVGSEVTGSIVGAIYASLGSLAVIALLIGVVCAAWYQPHIRSHGRAMEDKISEEVQGANLGLSECLDRQGIADQVGSPSYLSIKDTLITAASARFISKEPIVKNGAVVGYKRVPFRTDTVLNSNAFTSLLRTAYPKVRASVWQDVTHAISYCYAQNVPALSKAQSDVDDFATWLTSGNFFDGNARNGFPDNRLHFMINPGDTADHVHTGPEAFRFLTAVTITPNTLGATSRAPNTLPASTS